MKREREREKYSPEQNLVPVVSPFNSGFYASICIHTFQSQWCNLAVPQPFSINSKHLNSLSAIYMYMYTYRSIHAAHVYTWMYTYRERTSVIGPPEERAPCLVNWVCRDSWEKRSSLVFTTCLSSSDVNQTPLRIN